MPNPFPELASTPAPPVKLLVLGHSDTDGTHLADPADGWPWVIERMLRDSGTACEVVHRHLFAGPTAPGYVDRVVEQERPDVVAMATSTHAVIVHLVSNRFRERWGERPARAAARVEQFVGRHSGPAGSRRAAATSVFRRIGRRIAGTGPAITPAALTESYDGCMRALARHEDIRTIVLGGAGFTGDIPQFNPGSEAAQRRMQVQLRELALRHRFDWLDHEELLGGPLKKLTFFHADGMHTDKHSQRCVAEAIAPLLKTGAAGLPAREPAARVTRR